jgi:hypothetical protein
MSATTKPKGDPYTSFLGRKHTEATKERIRQTNKRKWDEMQAALKKIQEAGTESPGSSVELLNEGEQKDSQEKPSV